MKKIFAILMVVSILGVIGCSKPAEETAPATTATAGATTADAPK
jgi:hypothetical protein